MAHWENRALIDLRVAGSNPAGQLLIYFHNVFPVLTNTLCRHASLVPRSRIKVFVRKPRRCSPRLSPPPPPGHNKIVQSPTGTYFNVNRQLQKRRALLNAAIYVSSGTSRLNLLTPL